MNCILGDKAVSSCSRSSFYGLCTYQNRGPQRYCALFIEQKPNKIFLPPNLDTVECQPPSPVNPILPRLNCVGLSYFLMNSPVFKPHTCTYTYSLILGTTLSIMDPSTIKYPINNLPESILCILEV